MAQLSQMSEFEVSNHLVDYFQSHLSGTTIWYASPGVYAKMVFSLDSGFAERRRIDDAIYCGRQFVQYILGL